MHLAHPSRARSLISLATAAVALALATAGCDDPAPPSSTPSAAGSSAAAPSGVTSSAPLDASAPDAAAGQGGAAPDASPLTDTPPALSATAPPKEATTGAATAKPKTDATASAKPSTAAAKPDAGAPTDAGAVASGEGSTTKPGPSAAPADKPADLPPPAPGSADAIAAQIDAIFVGKKTFKARFKQEHTQKVSGVVKKQSGTLLVEKPNKISFRYDPPSQNRVVSDGSNLKVYIAEDTQMFVQPIAKTEYPGALAFLMGNGLRPSFTFTLNDKAKFDGGPVILGKPRSPTPHYEYVMFYVDKALLEKGDPNAVRRVLIVDAQGNKNRFDFEGASQPASIDPGEFIFNPPAGTTITNDAKK